METEVKLYTPDRHLCKNGEKYLKSVEKFTILELEIGLNANKTC